jgi:hypothetical protein
MAGKRKIGVTYNPLFPNQLAQMLVEVMEKTSDGKKLNSRQFEHSEPLTERRPTDSHAYLFDIAPHRSVSPVQQPR